MHKNAIKKVFLQELLSVEKRAIIKQHLFKLHSVGCKNVLQVHFMSIVRV